MIYFFFLWAIVANNPDVADIFPSFIWNFTFENEEDCIGAGVPAWHSLYYSSNLSSKGLSQIFLYFERLIRWGYLSSLPVSLSRTAPAKFARNCSGYNLDADCFSVKQLTEKSTALKSFCHINALVLLAGVLSSFLTLACAPLFVVASFDG